MLERSNTTYNNNSRSSPPLTSLSAPTKATSSTGALCLYVVRKVFAAVSYSRTLQSHEAEANRVVSVGLKRNAETPSVGLSCSVTSIMLCLGSRSTSTARRCRLRDESSSVWCCSVSKLPTMQLRARRTPSKAAAATSSAGKESASAGISSGVAVSKPPHSSYVADDASHSASSSPLLLFWPCFAVLGATRIIGTLVYPLIGDCDETFNYWEPTHYMMYGSGLQTWEYDPEYAFRSYAYVGLHALVAAVCGGAWGADKIAVFHRTRVVLALCCAACEAFFVSGVAFRLGTRTGALTLAALMLSAGMTHAAPAFLPSTFTMYGLLVAWGSWMRDPKAAGGGVWTLVGGVVVALALGWPFAVVALVPFGLHVLATRPFVSLLIAGVAWAVLVLGVSAVVDRIYYQRWLIAAWHIVLYNAFGVGGDGTGSDLYGVEPRSFYASNLTLNFNVQAALAAVSPLAVFVAAASAATIPNRMAMISRVGYIAAALSQLWLWFVLMSSRPHKEERFMFVVFPLISLAAAVTLETVAGVLDSVVGALWRGETSPTKSRTAASPVMPIHYVSRALVAVTFAAAALLSASRVTALVTGYSAPFAAWTALAREVSVDANGGAAAFAEPVRSIAHAGKSWLANARPPAPDAEPGAVVCVGKEWYRFPASFFLPERAAAPLRKATRGGPARLAFLKSGFGGQLPQPYLEGSGGASVPRSGFNDVNAEEPGRYIRDVADCDYVVDFELPTPRSSQDGAIYEPYFAPGALLEADDTACATADAPAQQWRSVFSAPFLHADSARLRSEAYPALLWSLARAFWIPRVSEARNVYGAYRVLRREAPCATAT